MMLAPTIQTCPKLSETRDTLKVEKSLGQLAHDCSNYHSNGRRIHILDRVYAKSHDHWRQATKNSNSNVIAHDYAAKFDGRGKY
jgi:hypothetical protein